jgi:hypothetical protein
MLTNPAYFSAPGLISVPGNGYKATTGLISLSGDLAINTVVACLQNPSATKSIFLYSLFGRYFYSKTVSGTVNIQLQRATGTPAGGSGSVSGSGIFKQEISNPDSTSSLRWGPTAITGLTLSGNPVHTFIGYVSSVIPFSEVIFPFADVIEIAPGTSLIWVVKTLLPNGSGLTFNYSWYEVG